MPYFAGQAGRPAYPAPRDVPRHRELTAAAAVAAVLVHLLLAQLTLVLAAVLYAVGRLSRWRPEWLAVPAAAGLLWTLAVGPAQAGRGLTAGPRHVLSYLGAISRYPGHVLRPFGAYGGLGHWLPGQFPLALILAAAEVLLLSWMRRRQGGGRAWRTGLVVTGRRVMNVAWLRSGGVVTRTGCCVGVDAATGRRAEISWREAEGGVLCTGPGPGAGLAAQPVSAAGSGRGDEGLADGAFLLAHAAIRRRKPVIVIDLAGSDWLAGALGAACLAPGAPLRRFGPDGPGYYEPVRGGDPARAASLVMGMIDWAGVGDQQRRSASAYLADALAVQAAAPRDRRVPVLDDLVRLMTPDALRERAARIPGYHPRRAVLADRAAVSASLLQADPSIVTVPATQIPRLRSSPLGRWLESGPADAVRISLGRTVRERGVTLLSLDRSAPGERGQDARMIGGLAIADLMGVCAELQGMSVPGDSLAWINGCEYMEQRVLAELIAQGRGAGLGVVLSTASAAAAGRLAADVNVLVARGPVDAALAETFARQNGKPRGDRPAAPAPTGPRARTGPAPGLASWMGLTSPTGQTSAGSGDDPLGAALPGLGADAFALLARWPQRRALPRCQAVAARMAAGPAGRPG